MLKQPLLPRWGGWPALPLVALVLLAAFGFSSEHHVSANGAYDATNADHYQDVSAPLKAIANWVGSITPEAWTALATVVVASFTVVLALVTNRQARLTNKALALAQREFVATHRPRLTLRFVETGPLANDVQPIAEIRVANTGETDATIVAIGSDIFRRIDGKETTDGWNAVPQPLPLTRVVKPSQELKFHVLGNRVLGSFDVHQIQLGAQELCLIGIVTYRDENGTIRTTSFARLYDRLRRRYMRLASDDSHADYEYEN